MRLQTLVLTLQHVLLYFIRQTHGNIQPNIVVIMADDVGWYDISLHGLNQFLTPNIDALALHGITLNRHYVPPMCTPSRAAFLTGKYPINTGMQHSVIVSDEPWGLPLEDKLLPEYLKDAGYDTHLIGKWHLGFFKKEYTPCQRGFDTFFGYYNGYIDYWDHNLYMIDRNYSRGYDMRLNETIEKRTKGIYATDLFNRVAVDTIQEHDKKKPMFLLVNHLAGHTGNEDDPFQAPESDINKFNYIQNSERRTYAAMLSKLDNSVGEIVQALNRRDMLDNTVILFYSDNGAPTLGVHMNTGSNFPFRGMKDSPWEGAVHGLAAIFSPLLNTRQRVSNQLLHVTDWFTTFIKLAGINPTEKTSGIDGLDLWKALSDDLPSPRQDVVHVIDDIWKYASYTNGKYKYIEGTRSNGIYDGWLGLIPFNETIERVNTNYANAIRNSLVGRTLSKYAVDPLTEVNKGMSDSLIDNLREQATVRCLEPPPTLHDNPYPCNPLDAPCLFDIHEDPCEYYNVATVFPKVFESMKILVQIYRESALIPRNLPADPLSDPAFHNNTWTWWY